MKGRRNLWLCQVDPVTRIAVQPCMVDRGDGPRKFWRGGRQNRVALVGALEV
jgi:hypothetical protein